MAVGADCAASDQETSFHPCSYQELLQSVFAQSVLSVRPRNGLTRLLEPEQLLVVALRPAACIAGSVSASSTRGRWLKESINRVQESTGLRIAVQARSRHGAVLVLWLRWLLL